VEAYILFTYGTHRDDHAILTLQSGSDLSPTIIATDIIIVGKSVTRGGVHITDFKPSFRSSDGLNASKLINMFNV
jgi:hypothetical protein